MTDVRRNLKIEEVSLVGKPANPKAKVALFKSEDETGVAKKDDEMTLADRLSRGFAALAKIIIGDETVVDLSKLNAKLQDRAKALPEATQKAISTLPESELEKEDGSALVLIEIGEAFAKVDADLTKAKTELADAVAKADDDDEENPFKTKKKKANPCDAKKADTKKFDKSELPEAAQKVIGDLEKTAETQAADLKKSQDRIAKLEDANLTASLVARLEKLEQVIPADERDDEIKMLKGLPEDAREHWFKRLEKDNAALKESAVFKELGSDAPGTSGDAWATIESKAKELVTKAADGLTKEQAIDRVLQANPDLYVAYKAERAQALN